ncbi:hypothetical protein SDC9_147821 [bioreactor metagenome]|uniref:Uncharacterized protein n=1 Tax=bioreactor metagenome TaxID=1076179 RepID=A0A645EF01_9ZZZZ
MFSLESIIISEGSLRNNLSGSGFSIRGSRPVGFGIDHSIFTVSGIAADFCAVIEIPATGNQIIETDFTINRKTFGDKIKFLVKPNGSFDGIEIIQLVTGRSQVHQRRLVITSLCTELSVRSDVWKQIGSCPEKTGKELLFVGVCNTNISHLLNSVGQIDGHRGGF